MDSDTPSLSEQEQPDHDSELVRRYLAGDASALDCLYEKHRPLLLNILLTDQTGSVRGSGLPVSPELGPTVSLPYVHDVITNGNALISELTTGQMSGKPTVVLAYPVRQIGSDASKGCSSSWLR